MAVVYGQFGLGGLIQTTVVLISIDQTLIHFTASLIGPKTQYHVQCANDRS